LCLSLVSKRPGREGDHSPPSSAEVKNGWIYNSAPPYVIMAWCLVKHRDKCTFTYFVSYFEVRIADDCGVWNEYQVFSHWAMGWLIRVRVPAGAGNFFSSPPRPDGPANVLTHIKKIVSKFHVVICVCLRFQTFQASCRLISFEISLLSRASKLWTNEVSQQYRDVKMDFFT
jgi:hypothetical protein